MDSGVNMRGHIGALHEYANAAMPLATAVPAGTVVYNTTYSVEMRSNGARWVPLGPFTVDQNTRSDVVTGAIAESLMHSVNISDAARYMGPKGRLKIAACWSVTSSANAKNCRIRVGRSAGATGFLVFDSTVSGTSGALAEKVIYARGSESEQGSSAITLSTSGGFGWVQQMTGLNYAPGGDDIYVSFLAAPVGAGETCTLNWYSIIIEPGF